MIQFNKKGVKGNGTKKKIILPIKVIIIGCIIGLIVAGVGLFKQIDSKEINEKRKKWHKNNLKLL